MASRSPLEQRGVGHGRDAMIQENDVSLELARDGNANVVRLVTGGFLSRCGFAYEAVDDVQLAIDLALRWLPLSEPRVTVRLLARPDGLTVTVGPLDAGAARRVLTDVVLDGLELATVLERLVERVDVVDGASPALVLRRAREAVGA